MNTLNTIPEGYRINAQGHLVPESQIKPLDKLRDELVIGVVEAAREDVRHAAQRRLERCDLRHMLQQERLVRAALRAPCGGHGNRDAGGRAEPGASCT